MSNTVRQLRSNDTLTPDQQFALTVIKSVLFRAAVVVTFRLAVHYYTKRTAS